MRTTNCYSSDELRKFALGQVSAAFSERVVDHLSECGACEETVASLDTAEDTVVRSLRKSSSRGPADQDAVYEQAIEQVKSRPPRSAPAGAADAVGDYLLLEKLGAGGMGTVFRAVHTRLERTVAIKLLPARRMQDPAAVARFQREMLVVGQLNHPAIVQATDAGESDGVHFLAMEYVEGFDLAEVLARCGPLSIADACALVCQAAIGLAHAHECDIVHRDVKPSNVMLGRDGAVKILDLGLALVSGVHGACDELTTVGQLMGSLDYMAPEQCDSSHDVDARADIHGLSATLYKLLCGSAPYVTEGQASPLQKLKTLATAASPPTLIERSPAIPAELSTIVQRGLERDPADRFASMQELAAALEPWTREADIPALIQRCEANPRNAPSEPRTGSMVPNRSALKPTSPRKEVDGNRSGGSWWSWVGAGVIAATLLALAGYVIYLENDAGYLVIECASPDVSVKIMQGDKVYRTLQLEPGQQTTRIRSGQYEIVVDEPSDGLRVKDGKFTLYRGDAWLAKIEQQAPSSEPPNGRALSNEAPLVLDVKRRLLARERERENLRSKLGPSHPKMVETDAEIATLQRQLRQLETANPPLYDGRTFANWVRILETDRSPKVAVEGINALVELADDSTRETALRAIVRTTRHLSFERVGGAHDRAVVSALYVLTNSAPELKQRILMEELESGNSASRQFAIRHLQEVEPIVAAATDQDVAVRRVAIDRLCLLPVEQRREPAVVACLYEAAMAGGKYYADLATLALLEVSDPEDSRLVALLVERLNEAAPGLRGKLAWAIAKIGPSAAAAVPELIAIVESDDPALAQVNTSTDRMVLGTVGMVSAQEAAVAALGAIGPGAKAAIPALEQRLASYVTERDGLPDECAAENAIQRIEGADPAASIDNYLLGPGDVLGIHIPGIFGRDDQSPRVLESPRQKLPPSFGLPVAVDASGNLVLPYVGDVQVGGLTLRQTERLLVRAFTVDNKILADARILVALVERRTRRRRLLMESHTIATGDVLGVYIRGVLGSNEEEEIPVHFPLDVRIPPSFGYPMQVVNGSLSLPLVAPVPVSGLTLRQVTNKVRRAYTVDNKVLEPNAVITIGLMELGADKEKKLD